MSGVPSVYRFVLAGLTAVLLSAGLLQAQGATAPMCTASVLNRTAAAAADGSFALQVPVQGGRHRVRVVCEANGATTFGESAPFELTAGQAAEIAEIFFGELTPIPVALEIQAPATELRHRGERLNLRVLGHYRDGAVRDLTADPVTFYVSSSPAVATVDETGRVTAERRGRVRLTARYEGVSSSLDLRVTIPDDLDGDGLPNEFEVAHRLDPNDPADAALDLDGDGLTNAEEYTLGTALGAADTDADRLQDGEELTLRTDPLRRDSDEDRLVDGDELRRGTHPRQADSDGDGLLDGQELDLGTDPLRPDPTTQLVGRVVDGTGVAAGGAAVVAFERLTVTTAADGRFVVPVVPAGRGAVAVTARRLEGGRFLEGTSAARPAVAGGTTDVGTVALGPVAGALTGRVVRSGGTPAAFARVAIELGLDRRETNADATGFFRFDPLPAGSFTLTAFDPTTALRGRVRGTLAANAALALDVPLAAAGSFVGTLRERDGVGYASGAEVATGAGLARVATTTDNAGRYRLEDLPLGGYLLAAQNAAGDRGQAHSALSFTSQVVEVDFGFAGRGRVSGTVLTPTGNPVAAAQVTVTSGGVFAGQRLTTTTDGEGAFQVSGLFVGDFEVMVVTAETPARSGRAGGTLRFDGDAATVEVRVGPAGRLFGTVRREGGAGAVPNAAVSLTRSALVTVAGGDGRYEFPLVPSGVGDQRVLATDPASGACGRALVGPLAEGESRQVDVEVPATVAFSVRVSYRDGTPFAGREVVISPSSTAGELAPCTTGRERTDTLGMVRFPALQPGAYDAVVQDPVCAATARTTVVVPAAAEGAGQAMLQVPFTGRVVGLVRSAAGAPVSGVQVTANTRSGFTDPAGRFDLHCVPGGDGTVTALDPSGAILAAAAYGIQRQGETVERTLELGARGVVQGRVTNPDGSAAVSVGVEVRQGEVPRFALTNNDGRYQVRDVPAGPLRVRARDVSHDLAGEASGELHQEGETITVDVVLGGASFGALYDANNYVYPVRLDSGALIDGTQTWFRGDGGEHRDALRLALGPVGNPDTAAPFVATSFERRLNNREVVVRGEHPSGLAVRRQVLVPADGYFARYLEHFTNPTAAAITVDVVLDSYFRLVTNNRDGASFQDPPEIVATSSGEPTLSVPRDYWAVADVRLPSSSPVRFLYPALAHVFGDGAAAVVPREGLIESDLAAGWSRWRTVYTLTVPPGSAVALLHFASQENGRESAVAAAERLAQLPPEALTGLTAADLAAVANFAPARLAPFPEPLPNLEGSAEGVVYEADGTTPVPFAVHWFTSDHPLFNRRVRGVADANGRWSITGRLADGGYSVAVPRFAFTVEAEHPDSGYRRTASGVIPQAGSGHQDVRFAGSGQIRGVLQRPGGELVTGGRVTLAGGSLLAPRVEFPAGDGRFQFGGLPPGTYLLTAEQPHAQGSPLVAEPSVTVRADEVTALDLFLPATGNVTGTLRTAEGAPVLDLRVDLVAPPPSRFRRQVRSDTAGGFLFPDVPAGSYLLSATEPGAERALEVLVQVAADATTRQDLRFLGRGTVVVEARYPGGAAVAGARVALQVGGAAAPFLPAGVTDAQGRLTLPGVPAGAVAVRGAHPLNDTLRAEAAGTVVGGSPTPLVLALAVAADQPPTVALVAPAVGATLREGASFATAAVAADDFRVVQVEWWLAGAVVGVRAAAPYELNLQVPGGHGGSPLELQAVATDSIGQRTVSAPVTITVTEDLVAPAISFVEPAAAAQLTAGATVLVRVVPLDDVAVDRVELGFAGQTFAVVRGEPFEAALVIPVDFAAQGPAAGTLTARAFDAAGNSATASRAVTVRPDAPPTLRALDVPPTGSRLREGSDLFLEVAATDDVGVEVQLFAAGELVATRGNAPFSFRLPVPRRSTVTNPWRLELVARDSAGHEVQLPPLDYEVVRDEPPVVAFDTPAEETAFAVGAALTIEVSASDDGGLEQLELFLGELRLATLTQPPYRATGTVPAGAAGPLELRAVATDRLGQTTTARRLVRRVTDNVAPTVSLTAPADGTRATLGALDVLLLIDVSSRTPTLLNVDVDGDGELDSAHAASVYLARQTLAALPGATSQFAVADFDGLPALRQGLTADLSAAQAALDQVRPPTYQSPNLDQALTTALSALAAPGAARREARPVIFLYGLGDGTVSLTTRRALVDAGVTVHSVAVGPNAVAEAYRELSQATGGLFIALPDPRQFPAVLASLSLGAGQLQLMAEADDDVAVAGVTFRVARADGSVLAELAATTAPYGRVFSAAGLSGDTMLTVTAVARDVAGNETTSAPVTVTVTSGAPRPELSRLVPSAGRAGSVVRVAGRFLPPLANGETAGEVRFGGVAVATTGGDKFSRVFVVPEGFAADTAVEFFDGEQATASLVFQFDTDEDGLGDTEERARGLDPQHTDSDRDGLLDGFEDSLGTDPSRFDSDGDGLGDGFERRWGFDPQHAGETNGDPDQDGLSNLEEQTAGSSPRDADSDRDDLSDGDEVHQHGTDPTDADSDDDGRNDGDEIAAGSDPRVPDTVVPGQPLPHTLIDGDGYEWDVTVTGAIGRGSDDAFVSSFPLIVQGQTYLTPGLQAPLEDDDQELSLPASLHGTVAVSRKVFVPAAGGGLVRTLNMVDNRGSSRVEVILVTTLEHGSLGAARVVATSSGDLTVTPDDDFAVVDDGDPQGSHPTVAFAWAGPNGELRPRVAFTPGGARQVELRFFLTLEPGERRAVMTLAAQRRDRAAALTTARALRALAGEALAGLAAEEAAAVTNFFAYPDRDLDGLADADEGTQGTDPDNPDSDGGGKPDGAEVRAGSDPLDPADDRVTLPFVLVDGQAFRWDVTATGAIAEGTFGAFQGAFGLRVGGQPFPSQAGAPLEDAGREVVLGPANVGGLRVTRKVFAPATGDGLVRYLEILDNPGASALATEVRLTSGLGAANVLTTSSGDATLDAADHTFVNGSTFGQPALAFALGGPNARLAPWAVTVDSATRRVETTYRLTVPAQGRVILLHLAAQRASNAEAFSAVTPLGRLAGAALAGLSPAEQADIANWFAYDDGDLDGLTAAEEAAAGTRADVADSDGDGLLDGFEVRYQDHGFNPNAATSPAATDPDDDGLDNAAEQRAGTSPITADSDADGANDGAEVAAGTDPRLADSDLDGLLDGEEMNTLHTDPLTADSDAGGRSDGQEVREDGTDPLDGSDDARPAGTTLLRDGNGEVWSIAPGGAASAPAFATPGPTVASGMLTVDGVAGPAANAVILPDPGSNGQELRYGPVPLGGLQLTRKVFVPDNAGFVRYLELLRNPGPTPVTSVVSWRGGSNRSNAFLGTTSSGAGAGDNRWTFADRWVTAGAFYPQERALLVYAGDRAFARPRRLAEPMHNMAAVEYQVTVPPGGQVALLHFAALTQEPQAAALGDALLRLDGEALTGLSDEERAAIVNFVALPDADGDGLADMRESALGANPAVADSDGDGVPDGEEVRLGTHPASAADGTLDLDGDGLDNAREVALGTDGLAADSDGDDLPDGFEVTAGSDPLDPSDYFSDVDEDGLYGDEERLHGTDPTRPDSDGDGLLDGFEVAHGLNPLNATLGEAAADPDSDGLSNLEEQTAGSNPLDHDSDDDGLDDGAEVITYHTDPTYEDSDGDRLTDGAEVHTHGTNPAAFDTDGGGRGDGDEIELDESDPLDPADDMRTVLVSEPGRYDRLTATADAHGRLHLVWNLIDANNCEAPTYARLAANGTVDLVPSVLASGTAPCGTDRRRAWLDAEGFLHVLALRAAANELTWRKFDTDHASGGFFPADPESFAVSPEITVATVNGLRDFTQGINGLALAVAPTGHVHIAWFDDRVVNGSQQRAVHYAQLDREGQVVVADRFIAQAVSQLDPDELALAVDAQGRAHLAWADRAQVFYALLGPAPESAGTPVGTPGQVLIGATNLAAGDTTGLPNFSRVAVTPLAGGQVGVSAFRRATPSSLVRWVLDPSRDDRDGSAADPAVLLAAPRQTVVDGLATFAQPDLTTAPDGRLVAAWTVALPDTTRQRYVQAWDDAGAPLFDARRVGSSLLPAAPAVDLGAIYQPWGRVTQTTPVAFTRVVVTRVLPDRDDDRLPDFDEDRLATNPTLADTDGDGLEDGYEVGHGLDPHAADAALDADADGLSNLDEFYFGTDPQREDSDGDGASDGEEASAGSDPTRYDTL